MSASTCHPHLATPQDHSAVHELESLIFLSRFVSDEEVREEDVLIALGNVGQRCSSDFLIRFGKRQTRADLSLRIFHLLFVHTFRAAHKLRTACHLSYVCNHTSSPSQRWLSRLEHYDSGEFEVWCPTRPVLALYDAQPADWL